MTYHFIFADKAEPQALLPHLFELLYANMSLIAPSDKTYEEEYAEWFSNVCPALQKPQRQIVLMYCNGQICGYFQYYVNLGRFMMEEIQIEKEHQGKGLFTAFYSWLVRQLPSDIKNVEAYAHKANDKSQGILQHLGLERIGEDEESNTYHYRGAYQNLLNRYYR